MAAIKARFQGITTAGGYATNLGQNVSVWRGSDWAKGQLLAVNLMDVIDEIAYATMGVSKEEHKLTIEAVIACQAGTNTGETLRKAIADAYKAIGVDHRWTVAGERLAFDTRLQKDEAGFDQEDRTVAVAKVTFVVHYRTSRFDPYTIQNG